ILYISITIAPTSHYTLSLHDALPIFGGSGARDHHRAARPFRKREHDVGAQLTDALEELLADTVAQKRHFMPLRPSLVTHFRNERSEEHTSELQSRGHLVCRLLLEKKK